MALAETLNTTGLVVNILGVVLVFFYAFPQPKFEAGGLAVEDNTPIHDGRTAKEHREEATAKQATYRCRSQVGLALLGLGFVLQLVGTWV